MLLVGAAGLRAAEAYTYFDPADGSLNFCYDTNRTSRKNNGYNTYNLNNGSNTPAWYSIRSSVKELYFYSAFSDYRPTSCCRWAYGMSNLTKVTYINRLNTSQVTNMAEMFSGCSKLKSLNLSTFDTRNVTSMMSMFEGCSSLTSIDVSSFNTSKVGDAEKAVDELERMFYGCSSLTSLDISSFNIPDPYWYVEPGIPFDEYWYKGIEMLENCTALKTLYVPPTANKLGSSAFNNVGTKSSPCELVCPSNFTPEDTEMGNGWFKWKGGYFYTLSEEKEYAVLDGTTLTFYCDEYSKMHSGTVYDLNTGTTAPGWNGSASTVKKVVFDSSFEIASPSTCYRWFYNMKNLTTITGMEYFDTSSVTNMTSMFQGCSSLTTLDLGYFDTSNVTTMYRMFYGCTKLEYVDLFSEQTMSPSGESSYESTFVTSKVGDMQQMFYNCSSLKSLAFPGLSLKSSTKTTDMFHNCTAVTDLYVANDLTAAPSTTFAGLGTATKPVSLETVVFPSNATFTANYMLWKGGYFIDAIRRPFAVFDNGALSFYYENPEWAEMIWSETFECYRLSSGTATPGWSSKATSVTKVEFKENFKYVRPTSCYKWFDGMTKLSSITGMKYLNTSEVTNMAYMFQNCKKLTALDISSFTLKSGITSTSMMKSCTALKKLTIPSTAGYLNNAACTGVGTQTSPCELVCPSGFTPERQASGSGWFQWKGGYFKDDTPTPQYAMGDVNHDGVITVIDASLITEYVLGNTPAVFFVANADVNNDGSISVTDVSKIVEIVLGGSGPVTPPTHEYVDLGLTSKTLWATCNVGATSPEGYGNYYAWGETKPKSTYSWATYQYCNGSSSSVVDLGNSIAGTAYDAATANWGSEWVMPTVVQIVELLNQCKLSLATVNGEKGLNLTGPNGKSIFFPMTGYKDGGSLIKAGEQTYLWSSRKDLVNNVAYKSGALYLERTSTSAKTKSTQAERRLGLPIRAVRASSAGANEGMFEDDGILSAPVTTPADDAIYNLQGMKMEGELQPGIYVRNGKKYEVK